MATIQHCEFDLFFVTGSHATSVAPHTLFEGHKSS